MKQEEYRACMAKGLKGKQLGKEERKLEFCILSKLCSQKSKDREEAREVCLLPKEAKPPKVKRARKSSIDTATLASCVIKALDGSEITLVNLTSIIADCTGQKTAKPLTRERFIKQCFKENGTPSEMGGYAIKEAQRLRSFCTAQWKEQHEEG